MITDALKWITDLRAPHVTEIGGRTFSDKNMFEITARKYVPEDPLEFGSLSSFVAFVNNCDVSDEDKRRNLVIIKSWSEVELYIPFDRKSFDRKMIASATYSVKSRFEMGRFYEQSQFIAMLMSLFAMDDRAEFLRLLKIASNVAIDNSITSADDGVSQNVTMRTGAKRLENISVQNPFELKMFRTFPEIEQPSTAFIMRMQDSRDKKEVSFALFDHGGDLWTTKATESLRDYLVAEVDSLKAVVF